MEDLSFLSVPETPTVAGDQPPPDPLADIRSESGAPASIEINDGDPPHHHERLRGGPMLDDAECELVDKVTGLEYRLIWASVAAQGGDEMRSELDKLETQVRGLKGQALRDFVRSERDYRQHLLAQLKKQPDLERVRDALEAALMEATAELTRIRKSKTTYFADLAEANVRAARYTVEYGHRDPYE